ARRARGRGYAPGARAARGGCAGAHLAPRVEPSRHGASRACVRQGDPARRARGRVRRARAGRRARSRGARERASPRERSARGRRAEGGGGAGGRASAAFRGSLGAPPLAVEAELEVPAGSGLGASAALGVAIARAALLAVEPALSLAAPDAGARVLAAAAAW